MCCLPEKGRIGTEELLDERKGRNSGGGREKGTDSAETIKLTLANSAAPDQMPQNAASDQGLHYLH